MKDNAVICPPCGENVGLPTKRGAHQGFTLQVFLRPLREKVAEGRMRGISQGFTLIELLVVVLIIGILAAVAVPQYKIAVAKSRYSQVLVLANDILKAEKIYELTNGDWTDDLAKLSLDFPGYKSDKKAYFNGGYCSVTDKTISCIMHKTASFVSFLNAGKRENHCFFQTGEKADLFEKVCKNMCASNQLKTWPGWDSAKRCKIQ